MPDKLPPCSLPRSCTRARSHVPTASPPCTKAATKHPTSASSPSIRACLVRTARHPPPNYEWPRCTPNGRAGALPRLTRISPATRRAAVLLPPSRAPGRQLSIEQSASALRPAVREISPFYCARKHSRPPTLPQTQHTQNSDATTSTPSQPRPKTSAFTSPRPQNTRSIAAHNSQLQKSKTSMQPQNSNRSHAQQAQKELWH